MFTMRPDLKEILEEAASEVEQWPEWQRSFDPYGESNDRDESRGDAN